jgi:hypothetical protein
VAPHDGAGESPYEQPIKLICFGIVVVPGGALSGFPFVSTLVDFDDGEQSGAPPLNGTKAFAAME